ncbi:hypothetical protein BT69DRAFT_1283422 [Atractiella rhizophila]|nr:hypothetical protein BT69DRAFT_1284640 [Atractiella rhizophila]KAH8921123.1 hypothetical protein BT69DRAFT_1283422 [Atractiella rhizophila]
MTGWGWDCSSHSRVRHTSSASTLLNKVNEGIDDLNQSMAPRLNLPALEGQV